MATKITPKKFTIIIEDLVREKRMTHLEAVIHYCEQNQLEAHACTRWMDKTMRDNIQYDAEAQKYFPKPSSLV